jgi:diguanylate cyclase (GGDEF)-like protein
VGDAVLVAVVGRIDATVRETDFVFRWGGEEFVVLLPHTSEEECAIVAERVRSAVANEAIADTRAGEPFAVTVSIGSSWVDRFPIDAEALVHRADEACYAAKTAGRDRVVAAARV